MAEGLAVVMTEEDWEEAMVVDSAVLATVAAMEEGWAEGTGVDLAVMVMGVVT